MAAARFGRQVLALSGASELAAYKLRSQKGKPSARRPRRVPLT